MKNEESSAPTSMYRRSRYRIAPALADTIRQELSKYLNYVRTSEPETLEYSIVEAGGETSEFIHQAEYRNRAAMERSQQSLPYRQAVAVLTPALLTDVDVQVTEGRPLGNVREPGIIVAVRFAVKDVSRVRRFREIIGEDLANFRSKREPAGLLSFEAFADPGDERTYYYFQRWTSLDAQKLAQKSYVNFPETVAITTPTLLATFPVETSAASAALPSLVTGTGNHTPPVETGHPELVGIGQEYPPAGESQAIAEITQIHLALQQGCPAHRGPHRKHQGCVLARFSVQGDLPVKLRAGLFSKPRTYLAVIRFSNGGSADDRLPDAHGMSIKVLGVKGEKLLPLERDAETQDFIVCDNPVFLVRDVREMVEFENAQAARRTFSGTDDEFAAKYPTQGRLVRRFQEIGFLKPAADSPFLATYWSQTPSSCGEGVAVKYKAVPDPATRAPASVRDGPNFLREAMRDALTVNRRPVWFDFYAECQTDPRLMPVENPMILWESTPANTFRLARIEILPLPFESADKMEFCENLSFNPWHSLSAHRPLGGINRARRITYVASTEARHRISGAVRREPVETDVRRLWNFHG